MSRSSLAPALILLVACLLGAVGAKSKPTVKPKPVRAALERRYDQMRRAYFARDSSAVLSTRSNDCFSITPSGDTLTSEAIRTYIRASFVQVDTTLALEWQLGVIDLHGDTATVEVDQHWLRRQLKGGAIRVVDTHAHQRETWIRKNEQWFNWRVDHVRPGAWRVDGKRIDPSKPYDPSAPEYRPP